jgi:hypothetical protein
MGQQVEDLRPLADIGDRHLCLRTQRPDVGEVLVEGRFGQPRAGRERTPTAVAAFGELDLGVVLLQRLVVPLRRLTGERSELGEVGLLVGLVLAGLLGVELLRPRSAGFQRIDQLLGSAARSVDGGCD